MAAAQDPTRRNPWIKWYCSDWLSDSKLASCSLAAQGLWMRLLCVMHRDGEPYGHLRFNGRPLSIDEIARAIGVPPGEVGEGLSELEAAGVFTRIDGDVCSRRMMRDEQRRLDGIKHGSKAKESSTPQGGGGGSESIRPPRGGEGGSRARVPEARDQRVKQEATPPPEVALRRPGGGSEFTRWWDEEWERTRLGDKFTWSKADAVSMAACAKMAPASEVKRRISAMLDSDDRWLAQNATPRILRSQWNRFAVEVRPASNGSQVEGYLAELRDLGGSDGRS